MKYFNILILLAIISLFRVEISPAQSLGQMEKPQPAEKGPVYNPLRERPYSKSTVKVWANYLELFKIFKFMYNMALCKILRIPGALAGFT